VYGVGLNQLAAFLQVLGALLQLIGVAALAATGANSIWQYVSALSIGMIGQVMSSLMVLSKKGFSVWPAVALPVWLRLIRSGFTAIGLTLGQAAVLRIDRILVGLYLAASAVGIYSVAATATEVVWLLPLALSQVLFHGLASRSVDLATATKAKVASLGVALICAIGIYAVAPVAVDKIVGAQFHDAVTPLRILLLGAVLLSSYQLDAYILAARGRFGLAAGATVAGFGAMFLLDLVAIPKYGIVGAAWASVIAYGLMAVAVGVMVARIHTQRDLAPQRSS
jgi:O-antigen/teichoic acid export membrane protein